MSDISFYLQADGPKICEYFDALVPSPDQKSLVHRIGMLDEHTANVHPKEVAAFRAAVDADQTRLYDLARATPGKRVDVAVAPPAKPALSDSLVTDPPKKRWHK